MNQARDSKGRFKRKAVWGLIILMVLVIGGFMYGDKRVNAYLDELMKETPSTYTSEIVEEKKDQEYYAQKIETLKADVLARLAKCETDGVEDPDGAIIFDSNEVPSIGKFQFQRKTIKHYIKTFEGRDITNREAIEIAIDPEKSGALVGAIIFDNKIPPDTDWYNCSRKLGLVREVEIINKIAE